MLSVGPVKAQLQPAPEGSDAMDLENRGELCVGGSHVVLRSLVKELFVFFQRLEEDVYL